MRLICGSSQAVSSGGDLVSSKKPEYLTQESSISLLEALHEFKYVKTQHQIDELAARREMMKDSVKNSQLLCVDICYVLFGCPKDMRGRFMVLYWLMYATDGGSSAAYQVYREQVRFLRKYRVSFLAAFWIYLKEYRLLWRTFFRSRRVKKLWPLLDNHYHLSRPLGELRKEFGIRIVETNGI